MAEDTGQERTEEATPRRRQQATEKGQVARSRELSTMLVLLASVAGATFLGPGMVRDLSAVFERYLKLERDVLFDSNALPVLASQSMSDLLTMLAPFFVFVTIAALSSTPICSVPPGTSTNTMPVFSVTTRRPDAGSRSGIAAPRAPERR